MRFRHFWLLLVEVVGVGFGCCGFAFLLLDARSGIADKGKAWGRWKGQYILEKSETASLALCVRRQ